MAKAEPTVATGDLAQIRESVRALCGKFPGEYWRALDRERAYPTEFVTALTKAGFLAALIPEEYGGSGLSMPAAAAIMEEIQAAGCNGAACHAQMYTMGTLLRHGSPGQKARWLPAIAAGELRLQAFGVTEPTSGSDTLNLRTTAVREATTTSSTARRSGHRGRSIPIFSSSSLAPRRAKRQRRAPTVFRSSSSTCALGKAPASPSIRSAP